MLKESSTSYLGPGCREFESRHSDHFMVKSATNNAVALFYILGEMTVMDFSTFDTAEMDKYAAESKAKWGKTEAYTEFKQKTAGASSMQMKSTGAALMGIFAEFGTVRHLSPASEEAQSLVAKLQGFITEQCYTCTKQILCGLGQMYIAGDSMTENIDQAGGEGTARFVHKAIEEYCK